MKEGVSNEIEDLRSEVDCTTYKNLLQAYTQLEKSQKESELVNQQLAQKVLTFQAKETWYSNLDENELSAELVASEAFNRGILASLISHITVIDCEGKMLTVNRAWDDFAKANGVTTLVRVSTGNNYLEVCKNSMLAGDEIAGEAMVGILSVINHKQPVFEMEYPCHSASIERWYNMRVKKFESNIPGFVITHYEITQRKKAEQEVVTKNNELKRLSSYLQNVREEERKYLAREVHDELGQLASVIKMDIDWLEMQVPDHEESYKKRLSHASSVSDLMIDTIRKLASDLRPAMLDELGLSASVESACKKFTDNYGIPCVFAFDFDDRFLEEKVTTNLFRLFQEALNNSMQHAHATHIVVSMLEKKDTIELSITDDGVGFDTTQKNNTYGLISMRERMLSINGWLTVSSKPGAGTTICAVIPKIEPIP